MRIYGDWPSIPEAYTTLAERFLLKTRIPTREFEWFAERLLRNFRQTARFRGIPADPPPSRFRKVTSLFRGVDCANPSTDFTGRVLLASQSAMDRLDAQVRPSASVLNLTMAESSGDGPEYIDEISEYTHLKRAFQAACATANLDIVSQFKQGAALLEVYSCFPIVPPAFLLKCGFAATMSEAGGLLERHEVSVTGGMHRGGAPCNGPVVKPCMYRPLLPPRQSAAPRTSCLWPTTLSCDL